MNVEWWRLFIYSVAVFMIVIITGDWGKWYRTRERNDASHQTFTLSHSSLIGGWPKIPKSTKTGGSKGGKKMYIIQTHKFSGKEKKLHVVWVGSVRLKSRMRLCEVRRWARHKEKSDNLVAAKSTRTNEGGGGRKQKGKANQQKNANAIV